MLATPYQLAGLMLFEPQVHADARGAFFESFSERAFRAATGLALTFVQDNHSISSRGVLRGLHCQTTPHAQGKLVRVVAGSVFDVAVDLRAGSPTLRRWAAIELSASNRRQLWIPPGFAHGFLALQDDSEVLYKTTDFWDPACECAVRWDDPQLSIDWPLQGATPLLSPKDAAADLLAPLPVGA